MRVSYDPEADAAYIQLADEIEAGGVARTYTCDAVESSMINLDFDDQDRFVGIEALGASNALPSALLRSN